MGILKNITDEYFGLSQRDEDKHPFEKYIENVEWVDIGNRKYLFAKTDFEDNTFESKELSEIFKVIEKYNGEYLPMTKDVFKWILNMKTIDIDWRKYTMDKILVYDKNGNEEMEIKIPEIGGYKDVWFMTKCDLSKTGLYYIMDYYSFINTNSVEKLNKCRKPESHEVYSSTSVLGNRFGIKLMKLKHNKS